MNRLKGSTCYLAGGIDNAVDLGRGWRTDIQNFLWMNDIGVLNPLEKPIKNAIEDKNLHIEINKLKMLAKMSIEANQTETANAAFNKIEKLMMPVVSTDLAMVNVASFVILYIDKDIHMCGSYNEEAWAALQKKPIIICCKQGKWEIPNFIFKRYNRHHMMFSSFSEVKKYLIEVCHNNDFVDVTNTWKFFDYMKVHGYETIQNTEL